MMAEFSDFMDPSEPEVDPNEESVTPSSFRFYDISQTVSVIA